MNFLVVEKYDKVTKEWRSLGDPLPNLGTCFNRMPTRVGKYRVRHNAIGRVLAVITTTHDS